jgi:5-methylcytosine-specific restriction protein A
VRQIVLRRDGHACQLRLAGCTGTATEVDHVLPVAHGGTDEPANLRASCQSCNRRRGPGRTVPARVMVWRW